MQSELAMSFFLSRLFEVVSSLCLFVFSNYLRIRSLGVSWALKVPKVTVFNNIQFFGPLFNQPV